MSQNKLHTFAGPDNSPEGLQLRDFLVNGPASPKVGDQICVRFTLSNANPFPFRLSQDGVFVACMFEGRNRNFGYRFSNEILSPGETVSLSDCIILDQAGSWEFWPAYHHLTGRSPYKWHEFQIGVATQLTGVIHGFIANQDKQPLSDVWITVHRSQGTISRSTQTDARGKFNIDTLIPGTYMVKTSKMGWEPAETQVNVPHDKATTVNFVLHKSEVEIVETTPAKPIVGEMYSGPEKAVAKWVDVDAIPNATIARRENHPCEIIIRAKYQYGEKDDWSENDWDFYLTLFNDDTEERISEKHKHVREDFNPNPFVWQGGSGILEITFKTPTAEGSYRYRAKLKTLYWSNWKLKHEATDYYTFTIKITSSHS